MASPRMGLGQMVFTDSRPYRLSDAILTAFLTSQILLSTVSGCVFPAFVQTNGTSQVWKGRILEQNTDSSLEVKFNVGAMLVVKSTDPNINPYTRICVQAYGADKFLVAHEETGQSGGRYTCMQILQRGRGLVQLRVAPLNKRMDRSLCDEQHLRLDDWVLIDATRIQDSRETCALHGGYEMTLFDNSMHQGVCDGYKGETRLESECEHGEGMTFYYRQTTCVPDGLYMYAQQRVVCMANWVSSHWTFTLIKHEQKDYMWILRVPTNVLTGGDESFTIHLFKDLVAEMSDIVQSTSNYLRLSMVRSISQNVRSLCIDDYEICSVLKDPCAYSDAMALTCSKACGVCNTTNPRSCTFKYDLQGRWADAADPQRGTVVINASSLSIDNRHNYQCIDWRNFAAQSEEQRHHVGEEKMVVATYTNGCRARYACARFVQNSPAAFFFQVSRSRRWPLITMADEKLSCEHFEYEHDSENGGPKIRYQSKHLRMLVSQTSNHTVPCDLEDFWLYDVDLKDNIRCSGEMVQAMNGTRDYMQFNMPDCPVQKLRDTYNCVEFSNFAPANDKLLVTRNAADPSKVLCWIFPQKHRNMFHLVEASQCNEISKRRIRRGRLRPIATFSKRKKKVPYDTSVYRETKVLNDTKQIVEVESETSTSDSVDVTESIEDIISRNETSLKPAEESSNPLVVAAVVITLMVFQIPFLCKCKGC